MFIVAETLKIIN